MWEKRCTTSQIIGEPRLEHWTGVKGIEVPGIYVRLLLSEWIKLRCSLVKDYIATLTITVDNTQQLYWGLLGLPFLSHRQSKALWFDPITLHVNWFFCVSYMQGGDNSWLGLANAQDERFTPFLVIKIKGNDCWHLIRDYNPPRCFQKKISGRGKHNANICRI
jgi:hypothetical protein